MKKNLWTEEMLRTLAELYPMETNAFTASVLQVGKTAVKEKARELGLVKVVKSKWLNRAEHIRSHFEERSFTEIARELGITRHSVSRIAGKLGLKRSKPESYQVSSRVRMEMIRRERRRVIFGLDPVTRIKVISHRAKVRLRSRLKSKGYVISGHKNVMYFTDHTQRKEKLENKATKLGLTFQPFPDDEVILLPNAI
ncbi:MAG TPA: MarR family transcriptional regulator [Bacteroides sp.]|jgi:hypothetical protein|nr:MarR family transcriptional regulator [Bacteroides sp.]